MLLALEMHGYEYIYMFLVHCIRFGKDGLQVVARHLPGKDQVGNEILADLRRQSQSHHALHMYKYISAAFDNGIVVAIWLLEELPCHFGA